ncbi:MAG: pyridoxamine 5'-phosphate oxidase family protein, partial [Gammaproteobacteria bacterium]|nr:pyridoxamine 5'-phosphate oxidase family protein [Gammaproteobacteria bacterium]
IEAGKHSEAESKGINVGAGEMGIEAVIFPGPPLRADQVMSGDHREYQRGMTCAECHDVSFDAVTSATRQFVNNFPALPQDEIWQKILAFLPGRERFAIATVANDVPIATTVDMVLDPEERVFFVVSEVGTEKLLQLRNNPAFSAVRYKGWTVADGGKKEWRSVQIRGTAEIIESDDPRFMQYLKKYNLVRVTPERAVRRFDLIRVTPQQIYYFDTELYNVEASVYQMWNRT